MSILTLERFVRVCRLVVTSIWAFVKIMPLGMSSISRLSRITSARGFGLMYSTMAVITASSFISVNFSRVKSKPFTFAFTHPWIAATTPPSMLSQ